MRGRLLALWLLGTAFVLIAFRRLFFGRDKLSRFGELYGQEGLVPVTPNEHSLLTLRYHCTACGECDREERARMASTKVGYGGMMATMLGGTRSLLDAEAVAQSLIEVPDDAIARAEAHCPEGVPITQLVQLLRGHAARQDEARQRALSGRA